MRQSFNAPISSEKINLFNDQFVVDVSRLSDKTSELDQKLEEANSFNFIDSESATPGYYSFDSLNMTVFGQKISYSSISESYVIQSATPYLNHQIEFYAPGINSSKVSFLSRKLDELEKTINSQ